jgi:monothiol glutaredoxin
MTTDAATPPVVRQIAATELKAMLDAGAPLELVDVRTTWEREIAHIEGSRLLDAAYGEYLLGLPRDTVLVFHCHLGIRSQAAAESCIQAGFTNVYNVVGGIDQWSAAVDPAIPRY